MKRIILIALILLSVAVAYYVSLTSSILTEDEQRVAESALLSDALYPARPVWWSDGKILAVGILPDSASGEVAAQKACDLLNDKSLPVKGLRVEVYDVLKIQNEDDWKQLGFAVCE